MRGLQCHKQLWFLKNRPELKQKKPQKELAAIESGIKVGDLAKELFPGGVEIEFDASNFKGMLAKTKDLIEQGTQVIYEAAFSYNGSFVMVDILAKVDGLWHMYEVKESTRVKSHHVQDAALQWSVLVNGLDVSKSFVIHINKHYSRDQALDIKSLFSVEEVTEQVLGLQGDVKSNLIEMVDVVESSQPETAIGPHCKSPFACDFRNQCWPEITDESVFKLYRLNHKNKFKWFHQGVCTQEEAYKSKTLNAVQKLQVETRLSREPVKNLNKIKEFLNELSFPIYFFDFETFMEAIPRFEGQRPYMQMPFQYSLHVMQENGELEHFEFLGDEHTDPREDLIKQMLSDLQSSGSIVAYYQKFETSRIQELAKAFPKYSEPLLDLLPRFSDLLDPFRNLGYYHPDFNGSFSIKSVLPALFPDDSELDYKQLNIQNGGMAMDTFAKLHLYQDRDEVEHIRQDLLAYCHLDTLAMVRIYQKLIDFCRE